MIFVQLNTAGGGVLTPATQPLSAVGAKFVADATVAYAAVNPQAIVVTASIVEVGC